MRTGLISSLMVLVAGMGTVLADPPAPASTSTSTTAAPPARTASAPAVDTAVGMDSYNLVPNTPAEAGEGVATEPAVDPANCGQPNYKLYGSIEYLLWKIKDAPIPPTQLTLPISTTGLNQFQSSTTLGGVGVDYGGRSGGRVTIGSWVCPDQELGIEGSFFWFERRENNVLTAQQANLSIPVTIIQNITTTTITNGIAQTTITQTPVSVIFPGVLTVAVNGSAGPTTFWGGELNARSTRCYFGGLSLDALVGFRYIELDETFNLTENINLQLFNPNTIFTNGAVGTNGITIPPIAQIPGLQEQLTTTSQNTMSTHNKFYGAQVGSSWEWWVTKKITFSGYGKIGVGAMIEDVTVTGATTTVNQISNGAGGFNTTSSSGPGGVFPVVGMFNQGRTRYEVVPEINMKLGYQLTPCMRLAIGYNFLYLTSVVRPGDQLNFQSNNTTLTAGGTTGNTGLTGSSGSTAPAVASTQINTFQPSFVFHDTDFWTQGLTASIEFRY